MTLAGTRIEAAPAADRVVALWIGPVAKAWIVSRALIAAGLLIGTRLRTGRLTGRGFVAWDGQWYLRTAVSGYGAAPAAGRQSPWPFFPLLPTLLRVFHAMQLPAGAVMIVANHLLIGVALVGVWHLAGRHFDAAVATRSVWIVALFPMSGVFSMLYPSAIFLAASVWAFELAERRRWALSGVAACVAAIARPNGALVATVLLAVVLASENGTRRRHAVIAVAGPAFVAVAVWMGICAFKTGDPFVFVTAKAAWHEQTVVSLVRHLAAPHLDSMVVHVGFGLAAAIALAATWTHLPRSWRALAVISITVPLASGLVGLGRYTIECFPFAIAGGAVLARVPRHLVLATGVLSACAALAVTAAIAGHGLVP